MANVIKTVLSWVGIKKRSRSAPAQNTRASEQIGEQKRPDAEITPEKTDTAPDAEKAAPPEAKKNKKKPKWKNLFGLLSKSSKEDDRDGKSCTEAEANSAKRKTEDLSKDYLISKQNTDAEKNKQVGDREVVAVGESVGCVALVVREPAGDALVVRGSVDDALIVRETGSGDALVVRESVGDALIVAESSIDGTVDGDSVPISQSVTDSASGDVVAANDAISSDLANSSDTAKPSAPSELITAPTEISQEDDAYIAELIEEVAESAEDAETTSVRRCDASIEHAAKTEPVSDLQKVEESPADEKLDLLEVLGDVAAHLSSEEDSRTESASGGSSEFIPGFFPLRVKMRDFESLYTSFLEDVVDIYNLKLEQRMSRRSPRYIPSPYVILQDAMKEALKAQKTRF